MLRSLPPHLRRVARTAGFAGLTGALLAAYAARDQLTLPDDRDAVRDRWVRRWSGSLLRLFGISLEIYGVVPPPTRGRLVVANHRSTIDIGVMLHTFGGHMVSRADLSEWPVLGPAARAVGTVFVERKDAASGASAIREIRRLLTEKRTVILFPEGTTFDGDAVQPFHPGAFVAALRTGAEIVPVGLAYPHGSGAAFVNEPFLAHLSRMAGASPSRVTMCIGEPLLVAQRSRAQDLRDAAHRSVQALVEEARVRCEGCG